MGAGTVVGRLDNLPQETIDKILEVAENPHPKFVVTLTPTAEDYSGTMDKTVAEINAAYEAGQEIWFKVLTSASTSVEIPLTYWGTDSSYDYHGFSANIVQVAANMLIVAYVSSTSDGTNQTYSTEVYPLTPASSGD